MTADESTTPSPARTFTLIVIGAVALSVTFVLWMKSATPELFGGLDVGRQAPELRASVWVNGSAPDPEQLKGEVYVVVAWATWCAPCYREAPELVEIYDAFKDRGVQFYGLTGELPEEQDRILKWIKKRDIPWPNGFGREAIQTLSAYEGHEYPAIWVIGRDGKVWWNRAETNRESLQQALRRTLEKSHVAVAEAGSST